MKPVAKNLIALIESKNTTQAAMAAVAGASTGAVSAWVNGKSRPRDAYLHRIADYYKVDIDDLTSDGHGLYAKVYGLEDAAIGAVKVGRSGSRTVQVLGAVHSLSYDEPREFDGEVQL